MLYNIERHVLKINGMRPLYGCSTCPFKKPLCCTDEFCINCYDCSKYQNNSEHENEE